MNQPVRNSSTHDRLTLEQAVGQKMVLAFHGQEPSPEILATLRQRHIGGVSLFRSMNMDNPAQVRVLTAALQAAAAASGQPPILIAADQEGGQLNALPGLTRFPGNMALGATGDDELARRVGYAIGRELAAVGVNVDYAPVCDVNASEHNSVLGVRAFGGDPVMAGRLAAAMVRGLQDAGVAATAKHFPGHGDTTTDAHYQLDILNYDAERLRRVELPPFAAAIEAGTRLVMTAHIALPALNDGLDLPATLSPRILRDLLRRELGFEGVIISDAMNMHAIQPGPTLAIDCIVGVAAGLDLLLLIDSDEAQTAIYDAVLHAARRGLLSVADIQASAGRVLELKSWLAAQEQPDLAVVSCEEHLALAREVPARSITLVRDTAGLLPLRLESEQRVLAILPRPEDLTPADTSSYENPELGSTLRRYHPNVDEIVVSLNPSAEQIAELRDKARAYDLVVAGTINAISHPGQAKLVRALLDSGTPVVAVALRLPYDLDVYPEAPTYICTYSLLPASLDALAQALWGHIPFAGRLPVSAA